jgi:hypothetical protein
MPSRPFEGSDSLSHDLDFLLMSLPADLVSQIERARVLFQLHQLLHQPFAFGVSVIHDRSWRMVPDSETPQRENKRDADSSGPFVQQIFWWLPLRCGVHATP